MSVFPITSKLFCKVVIYKTFKVLDKIEEPTTFKLEFKTVESSTVKVP